MSDLQRLRKYCMGVFVVSKNPVKIPTGSKRSLLVRALQFVGGWHQVEFLVNQISWLTHSDALLQTLRNSGVSISLA